MIGRSGERGPGISMLAARHDDDGDMDIILSIKGKYNRNWLKKYSPGKVPIVK